VSPRHSTDRVLASLDNPSIETLASKPSAKKDWDLSQEAFDRLLSWLNRDRETAGKKYEEIRRRLIKIFSCQGCIGAEDLADETINRVARKLPEICPTFVGDPTLYFLGVAHNVCLEYFRKKPEPEPPPPLADPPEQKEKLDVCLEECLQRLTPKSRELILEYYHEEKHSKIDHRKELAQRLGIALNASRIQAHRIPAKLQECVFECVKQRALA